MSRLLELHSLFLRGLRFALIGAFLSLIFTTVSHSQEGRLIPNPIRNIPKWVRKEINARHMEDRYTINYRLYPYYLKGDFNGDRRRDVALQIQEKSSGKMGVMIVHQRRPQALSTFIAVLGAGDAVGGAGSDFSWANQWNLVSRRSGGKRGMPELAGDAIQLAERDSASTVLRSGMLYWNGKRYDWFGFKSKQR